MKIILLIITTVSMALRLELVSEGLSKPIYLCSPLKSENELYVVEQRGKIIQIDNDRNSKVFLDIRTKVKNPTFPGDERGLLGMAFHPDYINNGYFFVNYIDNSENTIISNHSSYGILAYSSKIEASNCQINDNGAHDVFLFAGGDYRFSHCTFANYSPMHQAPSIRMSNYYEDVNGNEQLRPMERADFENCIIYGKIESEIGIEESENTTFNYKFNNCLIKLKESDYDISNTTHFSNNIFNENPEFIQTMDFFEYNYDLDTLSAAQNSAASNIALQFPYDLNGNSRLSDNGPDIGAYERIE